MLIFRKVVMPECKLLVSLRVYRSNVMSNSEALAINLFIEGTALQMGISGFVELWNSENRGLSLLAHMINDL